MVKMLSFDTESDVVRDVEVPTLDGSFFTLRARMTRTRIVVEAVSDENGRISTVEDLIRETGLSTTDVRNLIEEAFVSGGVATR